MFKILITDDDYEDRELLKMEIKQALEPMETNLRFFEAVSVRKAKSLLDSQHIDLMTLDVQLDRMNEGIDALPDLFESYPTLNIIVVSGRLDKREVTERLFSFTKNNVLKGKRWTRHFDVLDKKDNKREAFRNAYTFALKEPEIAGNLRELFLKAESYMEKGMLDKCIEIYHKIQDITPGNVESSENIHILRDNISIEHAREYLKQGDKLVASLLLGYYLEKKLKAYTNSVLGYSSSALFDCLTELIKSGKLKEDQKNLFQEIMRLRNKAIHTPDRITKRDFDGVEKKMKLLEGDS